MCVTNIMVNNRATSAVILLLLVSLLSACGQKGPLFLPGEPEQLAQHTAIVADYSAKDLMVD
ncbi:lipoprotein [Pseudomonadales bacterium]|jgi:predicted small lipoprotein YifL|nr:lipoprotein [Pseudomonadales bacterium]MDB2450779.1 lipoprotein [Pseudomonadales bacterium]MDC1083426.1 lipoprotein [Pseudomonadales bacterium]MDC6448851.1 lipoprotein [Pseudomonadales bacterium]